MTLGMEEGLGPGHIVLDGDPTPSRKSGQSLPVFGPFPFGQKAGCIKMPLGIEVGLSPGDFVRWGFSPLPRKGHSPPPQLLANVYYGQTAVCIRIPLGMEVGSA